MREIFSIKANTMLSFPHIAITLLALAAIIYGLHRRPLSGHGLFYFVIAQIFVYIFVAPTYRVSTLELINTPLGWAYFYVQAITLCFFLPAFYYAYDRISYKSRETKQSEHAADFSIDSTRLTAFVIVSAVCTILYLGILQHYGLLFRSLGHERLAAEYAHLPRLSFIFIRVFDRLLLPLVILNLIVFLLSKSSSNRTRSLFSLLVTTSVQLIVCTLNSRLLLITTILMLFIVASARKSGAASGIRFKIPWKLLGGGVFVLIAIGFTANLRNNWQGDLFQSVQATFVAEQNSLSIHETLEPVARRLDGVDLIAQMMPELHHVGYSYGESWKPSIITTFGILWDSEASKEIKASLGTSPKYQLMYEYAGIDLPDYPSCILTDAYGNFGIVGVLLAGSLLGGTCGLVKKSIANPTSVFSIVFGVAALGVVSKFESSMLFHLLTGWSKCIPSILILYVIVPLRPLPTTQRKSRSVSSSIRLRTKRTHRFVR